MLDNDVTKNSVILDADALRASKDNLEKPSDDSSQTSLSERIYGFLRIALISTLILSLIGICYYFARQYFPILLLWVQTQADQNVVLLGLVLLYALVSLPFTWGYILLNMATGYIYGFKMGFVITLLTASVGSCISHGFMKYVLKIPCIKRCLFSSEKFQRIHVLLSGSKAFKLVCIARLTPIPFGFQNAVFALGDIPSFQYIVATFLGLIPCQLLNVYMGSTLRSMEEVLNSDMKTLGPGFYVLILQLVAALVLGIFLVRKARNELAILQEEHEESKNEATPDPEVKVVS